MTFTARPLRLRTLTLKVPAPGASIATVADDLRSVQASVSALARETSAFRDLDGLISVTRLLALLSALVAAWLATLAAGCIWLGRSLQRDALEDSD